MPKRLDLINLTKQYTPEAYDQFWAALDGYYGQKRKDLYETITIYLRSLFLKPQALRIADVGCGPGYLLHYIAGQLKQHELSLLGVDWSATALQQAQQLLQKDGAPPAAFVQADLQERCPIPQSADAVLCIQTIEHPPDPVPFMRHLVEMSRRHVILTVPDGPKDKYEAHVNFWSVNDFRSFLEPFGHVVTCKHIRRGNNILAHLERA